MLDFECAGEQLKLLAEKAVFWPRQSTLIVADLHLGKPAAFRNAGIPVPETTTDGDLQRLQKIIWETKSRRLVILGDFFHARSGLQREMLNTVSVWREQNRALQLVLVPGNHDKNAGVPPSHWAIEEAPDPGSVRHLNSVTKKDPQPKAIKWQVMSIPPSSCAKDLVPGFDSHVFALANTVRFYQPSAVSPA